VTSLGLSAVSPRAEVAAGFRSGWLKHVGVAVGGASGAAIVLGAYDVLRSQPDRAFSLLQGWGPAFLLAIVAMLIVGRYLEGLNLTVRESFSVVAGSLQSGAEATGRTADALTKLADQGGRQAEQVERLAIYAAQEFPGVYERLDRQDEVLQDLVRGMKGLHSMLSSEKAALDRKDKGSEERDGSGT
jgi:hypothetical protein